MSLYIGNLSMRTRRDDLEHVFRRYGRCNVQLKDGYGFVVYDFPLNAEKALKALQGSNICGEPLSLTWSNKQPKPVQRFARGARSHEMQRGKNSARGNYVNRKTSANFRLDFNTHVNRSDSNERRLISANMLDDETSYRQDNVNSYTKEKCRDNREDMLNEGGSVEKPNPLDTGRWGEQLPDSSNDFEVENRKEFDDYEPYQGYDRKEETKRKEEDENHQVAYSGGSPAPRSSQEKTGGEQIGELPMNHPNGQKTCYSCGKLGHKRSNCPRENASRRKFSRFGRRQYDDINTRSRGEGKLKNFAKSWGKLQSSRDTISMRRHGNDSKASGSGKHQTLVRHGSSPAKNETDRARRKDYGAKKRSTTEIGTPRKHSAKKARLVSSPFHSDYTASRSRSISRSSKSVPRSSSHARSRSVSSRGHSYSSNSRSSPTSHYSRSIASKSQSRSSSPPSLSLSVSPGLLFPSSPNKVPLNLKSSLDIASTHESKEVLVDQVQPVEADGALANAKLQNTTVSVNYENAVSSSKVDDAVEKDQPLQRDDDVDLTMSRSSHEMTNASITLSEKDGPPPVSLLLENQTETKEFHNSGELVMEHMPKQIKKPDSLSTVSSCSDNSTSISSEELYMVLKHYGLELPEENERHFPAEAYFGSARLWPWEIIYYRRLKKGPISTDNYARRVAQNREFGIVDKYIRSSSGWGELSQETQGNP